MIYLSHTLAHDSPMYGNRRENLSIKPASSIANGDQANSHFLAFNTHAGTHVDLPKHFDDHGRTLNDYPPDFWEFNTVRLADIPCEAGYLMSIDDIQPHIDSEVELLLIRTGFERYRGEDVYWQNNPSIGPGVGLWLREHYPTLRAIGFDSISLNCYKKRDIGCEVHREFLSEHHVNDPILIIEDMKLAHVRTHITRVIAAPFLIDLADGTPITVMATEE